MTCSFRILEVSFKRLLAIYKIPVSFTLWSYKSIDTNSFAHFSEMKHKVLIIFLVACVVAVADCKKDRKCFGLICARRGSGDGREEDYEPCEEFCERREREKQRVKDEERACSSRKGRSRGKEWGRGRCRGRVFELDRKDRSANREEMTREKDCACQEKKTVRRRFS